MEYFDVTSLNGSSALEDQSGWLLFYAISSCILLSGFTWLVLGQPSKRKIEPPLYRGNYCRAQYWDEPRVEWPPLIRAFIYRGRSLIEAFSYRGRSRAESRVEWTDLPIDIQERVIQRLPYEQVSQLKVVSKGLRDFIEGDLFLSSHDEFTFTDVTLTAPYFYIKDGVWEWAGYDSSLQKWRRLPPLSYLPEYCKPDLDKFMEYLVCTRDGLVCMNVSKSVAEERLIVFNPLTRKWRELPPLQHRRNPVLMHLLVHDSKQTFQVIVVGSFDEHLSRITEEFDSGTWKWKRTGDLPGPAFALNDYQTGVYQDGNLHCIVSLDQDLSKDILRYDLNRTYPIPFSTNSTILQLVEGRGKVYLFSEQVNNRNSVEHCVDRVEWDIDGTCRLHNVVRRQKMGGRSLRVYPEYICVPFSEHQVCVMFATKHSGVIYDIRNEPGRSQLLQAPSGERFGGQFFNTLNPLSFTIEPQFKSKILF